MADGGVAAGMEGGGGACMGAGGGDGAAASWGAAWLLMYCTNKRHLITILVDCNKCTVRKT